MGSLVVGSIVVAVAYGGWMLLVGIGLEVDPTEHPLLAWFAGRADATAPAGGYKPMPTERVVVWREQRRDNHRSDPPYVMVDGKWAGVGHEICEDVKERCLEGDVEGVIADFYAGQLEAVAKRRKDDPLVAKAKAARKARSVQGARKSNLNV